MKVYKSQAKDIDLPEIDILTFLFGESLECSLEIVERFVWIQSTLLLRFTPLMSIWCTTVRPFIDNRLT